MRAHVFLHALAVVGLGLGLLAADCTGSGLTQDCEPGTLGCACGNFPECPKDEHNRVILCCPAPNLYCGPGNICKSVGSSGDGTGSSSESGTTSATDSATPTGTVTSGS